MSADDYVPVHVKWETIEPTSHAGTHGFALWRTMFYGERRVRQVEYSPGYAADHWCDLGHIVYCISGSLHTEFSDGNTFDVSAGELYAVEDDMSSHRSSTRNGAMLLIIDAPPEASTN